jgi:PAS domain S-box-containing protein
MSVKISGANGKVQADLDRSHMEHALLAAIVESSDDAIISKTLDGIITTWNAAAERIFGYSADEAIGQPILMLLPVERLHEEAEILSKLSLGERIEHLETVRLAKDGRQVQVSISSSPVRDASGRIAGASKIVRDISEKNQAEAAMLWQQSAMEHMARLNTMGEMAAGLAHELNQPLASILTYTGVSLDAIRTKSMSVDRIAQALQEVANETHRAGEIIRRLRDFIRKRDPKLESVDLNALVEDSVHLLEHEFRNAEIALHMKLAMDLPRIEADPVQFVQVLVNLLRNARDAMTDSGAVGDELTVSTRLDEDELVIDVVDRGCGVSEERLHRLFDRFYSTKAAGLGMGLAISRTIIDSLGGRLSGARNARGGGMTFSIRLPVESGKETYDHAADSLCCGR